MSLTPLHTIRLTLRTWSLEDVDQLFGAHLDPDLARFIADGRPVLARQDQEAAVARIISTHALWDHRMGVWAIEEKTSRRPVGAGVLKPLPADAGVEIGWVLARSSRGAGLATEAARALLDYGFGPLGLRRIIALVDVGNEASRAVCLRIGMKAEGVTAAYHARELELFAIAAPDLRPPPLP